MSALRFTVRYLAVFFALALLWGLGVGIVIGLAISDALTNALIIATAGTLFSAFYLILAVVTDPRPADERTY